MRKVFVLNNGGHNYDDAERFGQVVFCSDAVIAKTDTSQMFRELSEAMLDANRDDYILVSSLASFCMIAAGIMAARFGEVHLLIYDKGKYVERDVMFD